MINGKKERFEKILRVRYRNISVHKGRRANYITLTVFFFLFDILTLLFGCIPGMDIALIGFVFGVVQCILVGVLMVCLCSQLFASDRVNNQVGIELRSGYTKSDVYWSRVIEIAIAFLIIFVILAVLNGAVGGGNPRGVVSKTDKLSPAYTAAKDRINAYNGLEKNDMDPRIVYMRAFLVIDIWWTLITCLLTALITIGCSFIMKPAGATAMGLIFGIGITIVIILASVGTFSSAGFGTMIPGYGHTTIGYWTGHGFDYQSGTITNGFDGPHNNNNNMNNIVELLSAIA